jgi:hypothetical protein
LFISGRISSEAAALSHDIEEQVGAEGAGSAGEIEEQAGAAVFGLVQRIWARKPADLATLACVANSVATIHYNLWGAEFNKLEYEEQAIRILVESVLSLASERLVIEGLPLPRIVHQPWGEAAAALESRGFPVSETRPH